MKDYLLALLSTALLTSLVGILAPAGIRGSTARHLRLLCSLVLLCVLISPLKDAGGSLRDALEQLLPPSVDSAPDGEREALQEALDEASVGYFLARLTESLEQHFSIESGCVRVRLRWERTEEGLTPTHATVLLSGSAIWKDPEEIEQFVTALLGCACVSAIE